MEIAFALTGFAVVISFIAVPIFFAIYYPNWRRRQRLEWAGLVKHRVPSFAQRLCSDNTQRAVASRLDDRALFWAYMLPDHRPRAKQIVGEELTRRGYVPGQIAAWSPDPREIAVPSAIERPPPSGKYLRISKRRARWFQFYRLLILVGYPLAVLTAWILDYLGVDTQGRSVVVWLFLVIGTAIGCGIAYRNQALRILLLRPFGDKRMTKSLRRFVPKNIGIVGHVYTLQDRHYRPSVIFKLLILIPIQGFELLMLLTISPFIRNSLCVALVDSERKFRKLQCFLISRFRPSYWGFLNGSQAFNIRCSDPWWKLCIQTLMESCEIIVIDLSRVKEGTAWELNEIRVRSLLPKCLFVVEEQFAAEAHAILSHSLGARSLPEIFIYRANGRMPDPTTFRAYLQAVALPHLDG